MSSPTALVDSHAHLNFRQFDSDREAVLARARNAGVVAIVNVGTDLPSSRASIALAEQYPSVWATVGIHPHDAKRLATPELAELRRLARHPKVVAIGEIGLDYYRDLSPRQDQRRAFAEQLQLASELGLPVVVHSRDAHEDVEQILGGFAGTVILHSYSGGPARLAPALAAGYYISISGPVTFRKADELREVAARVPRDRMLVETDCPYLTPEPRRGRRNEPAFVRYVVRAVARAQRCTTDAVARATAQNVRRVFGIAW
jgi:TatD DNase family protein